MESPSHLSLDYEQPNEESLVAIRETEAMIDNGSGEGFANGHDLIRAALEWDTQSD